MAGDAQSKTNTVLDPVCGMSVDPENARGSAEHKGTKYFFCSPHCVERFNAEPEKYLASKPPAAPLVQLDGKPQSALAAASQEKSGQGRLVYLCPMDPDVRETKPGPCPTCGMALEAETIEY